jgi:hypothetical protein
MHGALRYLRDAFELPVPDRTLAELRTVPTTRAERWGQKLAFRRHRLGDGFVTLWDLYRRLRKGEHDSPIPDGYLLFVSDNLGLARRREIVPHVARGLHRASSPSAAGGGQPQPEVADADAGPARRQEDAA